MAGGRPPNQRERGRDWHASNSELTVVLSLWYTCALQANGGAGTRADVAGEERATSGDCVLTIAGAHRQMTLETGQGTCTSRRMHCRSARAPSSP